MIQNKKLTVPEIEQKFFEEFTRRMNILFRNKDRKNKLNKLNDKR